MTKNPFYNAILALGYITFVVAIISLGQYFGEENTKDNFLIPIGMLSLFVLSAANMGYIFFYQPVALLLEGKQKEAVRLFWKTIAIFACLTLSILVFAIVILKN